MAGGGATASPGAGLRFSGGRSRPSRRGRNNAAVRLAYIHNIGDVRVSLAPVAAGLLVTVTRYSIFDPLIAAGIAVWIIVSTVQEVFASGEELLWPEKIVCGHSDHEAAAARTASSRP
ncbi:MAG: hypothetical protein E6G78_21495 [Alphaproteobacteria bacterium]|nr:MAG: hypothetical protein E6G78_21495 [Alphaproteobacteria bacterium]